jgi:hypothetical protein
MGQYPQSNILDFSFMLAHLPSSLRRTEFRMILRLIILRGAIFAGAAIALLQMGALAQSGKIYRVG